MGSPDLRLFADVWEDKAKKKKKKAKKYTEGEFIFINMKRRQTLGLDLRSYLEFPGKQNLRFKIRLAWRRSGNNGKWRWERWDSMDCDVLQCQSWLFSITSQQRDTADCSASSFLGKPVFFKCKLFSLLLKGNQKGEGHVVLVELSITMPTPGNRAAGQETTGSQAESWAESSQS